MTNKQSDGVIFDAESKQVVSTIADCGFIFTSWGNPVIKTEYGKILTLAISNNDTLNLVEISGDGGVATDLQSFGPLHE